MAAETAGWLRFGVLGPLAAWRDGEPVRLGGVRQRALLALLSVRADELVSVELIVEQLFGEQRSDGAIHAVHAAVWRLRRLLGSGEDGPVLQTCPGGYRLSVAPEQLDVAIFQRRLQEGRERLAALGARPVGRGRQRPSGLKGCLATRELLDRLRAGHDLGFTTTYVFARTPEPLAAVELLAGVSGEAGGW